MKPVVFHDLAVAELDEGAAWYEERKAGLGAEFRIAIEDAVHRIQNNPLAGSRYGRTRFRFVLVRRFPFVVFYAEGEEAIRLMAVAHGRRRPGYWRKRKFRESFCSVSYAPPPPPPPGDDPLQPHALRAAPFALLAAAMAWALNARSTPPVPFRWLDLVGILLCMVTARSAAMAFNRLADRQIDALNPRTKLRHLPSGVLSVGGVLVLYDRSARWGSCWQRCSSCPTGFRWPRRCRYCCSSSATATRSDLRCCRTSGWESPWPWRRRRPGSCCGPKSPGRPVVLSTAVALWVAGFDMIYACQDYAFDVAMRLHSVPARMGVAGALRLAAACHFAMLVLLAILPWTYPLFGAIYLTGVAAIGLLLVYEHWLVRPDDLSRVNRAFFHINAVVSLGLLAVGVAELLR